jgi:hypothetical protein
MKKCIAVLVLFGALHSIQAQRHEFTIGLNRTHFYDFRKTARTFGAEDQFWGSIGWSIDNLSTSKLPYRLTLKLERYQGDVYIFNGGLGGGVTLDASVAKHLIALGLYPLNFSIKQVLDFNVGAEFNALILEKAKGYYGYYQGGSPPISYSTSLEDGKKRLSKNFGVGLNARIAYNIRIKKGWTLVPQYQIYAGVSDEFKDISSDTRTIRHYLAIGLARKFSIKTGAPKK